MFCPHYHRYLLIITYADLWIFAASWTQKRDTSWWNWNNLFIWHIWWLLQLRLHMLYIYKKPVLHLCLEEMGLKNLLSRPTAGNTSIETEIIGGMNKLLNSHNSIKIYRVVALVFKMLRQIKVIFNGLCSILKYTSTCNLLRFPSEKNGDKCK